MPKHPRLAFVTDPRFPGGTSSAIAAEIRALDALHPYFHAMRTGMFGGETIAPQLASALAGRRIDPVWDAPTIGGDVVVVHNPSFLKFERQLPSRIVAGHLMVVTHENFERPGGGESYDVGHCLSLIEKSSLALRKSLAPVSPQNRKTVQNWADRAGLPPGWDIVPEDWFNICDFDLLDPTEAPQDRRGRLSRPGAEKFPDMATLDRCFPHHAESNVILGADILSAGGDIRPHWSLHPFRSLDVAQFFEMIDFMVYYTSPLWRESFGRVLAEGIAAGKVVISDAETAAAFDGGVVAARPEEVDGIIADYVAKPARYAAQVRLAQAGLSRFGAAAFRERFTALTGLAA